MIKWVVTALAVTLAAGAAQAQQTFPYGSRVGQDGTVLRTEGINTSTAVAFITVTEKQMKVFCVEYMEDRSAGCPRSMIRERKLRPTITADCKTGIFVNAFGETMRLEGPMPIFDVEDGEEAPDVELLIRGSDGKGLDGSAASGYIENVEQLKILCPRLVSNALQRYRKARQ
jgi:hypothetical protein